MFVVPPVPVRAPIWLSTTSIFREGGAFVVDEEGMELRDVEAAQAEAARSLSGIAWDAMRSAGAQAQEMTIEVRDVYGPVMDVKFAFMINRKK